MMPNKESSTIFLQSKTFFYLLFKLKMDSLSHIKNWEYKPYLGIEPGV